MQTHTTRRQSLRFGTSLLGALSVCWILALSPLTTQAQEAPKLKIATNMGDIMIEVYPDKAPKTVANFLQYVKDK